MKVKKKRKKKKERRSRGKVGKYKKLIKNRIRRKKWKRKHMKGWNSRFVNTSKKSFLAAVFPYCAFVRSFQLPQDIPVLLFSSHG